MSLTHVPKAPFAKPQFVRAIGRRRWRQPPVAKPAQLIRAILVGLLLALLFLWALPHNHMAFAGGADAPRLASSV